MGWLSKLFNLDTLKTDNPFVSNGRPGYGQANAEDDPNARNAATKRLKLVLMHDRTQLSPLMMEKMRDELVEVISRYVEIDKSALDINLESESNTIALVANIPIIRAKVVEDGVVKPAPQKTPETKTESKPETTAAGPETTTATKPAATGTVTPETTTTPVPTATKV